MCKTGKIEWTPTTDGEANFYGFANKKDWLMRVQVNGEICVYHQAQLINLISAAPDMHEALEFLLDFEKQTTTLAPVMVEFMWKEALEKINKALAKAERKQ
jgi:hypothetical protein